MAFSSVFTKANGFIYSTPQHTTAHTTTTSTHTTELEQQSESGSMSPIKRRTEKWLQQNHTEERTSDGLELRKVKEGRVVRKNNLNGRVECRKKRKSFWNVAFWFNRSGESESECESGSASENENGAEDELEGDTMIDDTPNDVDDGNGSAPATPGHDNDVTIVVDDYDDDSGIKSDETRHALQKYGDRYLDYDDARVQEWTGEERWLFTKLTNRGFEPLLHATWVLDYPTFPEQLFTSDESRVYISNVYGSIGRACRSLTDLILAGSRVRDQILSKAATEKPLFHAIDKYYKWSLADGKVQHKNHIPVIAIASAKGHETVESVVSRVTDQLHSLGRQYRDKWRRHNSQTSDGQPEFTHELPTLTGFVIKYSIVAIVTCDSRVPGNPIRTLGTFDFKVVGQDVWHALAVSIAMIRGRNYLMQLDQEGELGPEIVDYGSDPDA